MTARRLLVAIGVLLVVGASAAGLVWYKAEQQKAAEAARATALVAESDTLVRRLDDFLDDYNYGAPSLSIPDVMGQLEAGIRRNPDHAPLYVVLARAIIIRDCAAGRAGCSELAENKLRTAIQKDPKYLPAHTLLAHLHINGGCPSCAGPHLKTARQIDPEHPNVRFVAGRILAAEGRNDEAEREYLAALEAQKIEKKKSQYYRYLAQTYEKLDQFDKVEWAYRKALAAFPKGAWNVGNLGTFLACGKGDHAEAIAVLSQAISMMPYPRAKHYLTLALYERWGEAFLRAGNTDATQKLFEEAKQKSADIKGIFLESITCAGTGHAAKALILSRQIERSALEGRFEGGRTPLMIATDNDNTRFALFLLEQGVDPNPRDPDSRTPLLRAAVYGNLELVSALLKRGADPNAMDGSGRSPVLAAATCRRAEGECLQVMKLLLESKAQIGVGHDGTNATFRSVCSRGNEAIARLLIEKGVKPALNRHKWSSAMAQAIAGGHGKVVQLLIETGIPLEYELENGQRSSYAEYAEKLGRKDMADLIRKSIPSKT